jgi:transposase
MTVLVAEIGPLRELVIALVLKGELCGRYMAIPNIGPITALLKATVNDPARFKNAKLVGAYVGVPPKRWQSGETIDRQGRISKMGDKDVRRCLFESAHILLTKYRGKTAIKTWGQKLVKAKGHHKATVAVARGLAMAMWAMCRDGPDFETGDDSQTARPAANDKGKSWTRNRPPALPVPRKPISA